MGFCLARYPISLCHSSQGNGYEPGLGEDTTVDSRYYDTDGIRKMYQYNQNFYCLGMVEIRIWYLNKQYFVITDIVITRVYCTTNRSSTLCEFLLLVLLVGTDFIEKIVVYLCQGNKPLVLLLFAGKQTHKDSEMLLLYLIDM